MLSGFLEITESEFCVRISRDGKCGLRVPTKFGGKFAETAFTAVLGPHGTSSVSLFLRPRCSSAASSFWEMKLPAKPIAKPGRLWF